MVGRIGGVLGCRLRRDGEVVGDMVGVGGGEGDGGGGE